MAGAMKLLATVLCVFLFSLSCFAKDTHAPLPDAVLQAKTVFISNQAGDARFADRCYDELQKWGRYKVVTDPKDADIIFEITTEVHIVGYRADAQANSYGDTTYATARSHPIRRGETYVSVVDAKTKMVYWSDAKNYGYFHSATREIVKDFRDRVEEQAAKGAK